MIKKILKFFDKLEDRVRIKFSHFPIFYAIFGAVGTILFWRGIWHTADFVAAYYLAGGTDIASTINFASGLDGVVSTLIGLMMLLITGLFVATFIGDHIIMSGLRGDKKVTERTEAEIKEDVGLDRKMKEEIHLIMQKLEEIEKKLGERKDKA